MIEASSETWVHDHHIPICFLYFWGFLWLVEDSQYCLCSLNDHGFVAFWGWSFKSRWLLLKSSLCLINSSDFGANMWEQQQLRAPCRVIAPVEESLVEIGSWLFQGLQWFLNRKCFLPFFSESQCFRGGSSVFPKLGVALVIIPYTPSSSWGTPMAMDHPRWLKVGPKPGPGHRWLRSTSSWAKCLVTIAVKWFWFRLFKRYIL